MSRRDSGFTLLEVLIAMAIAGLVLAVSVPAAGRFYQSMQYRAAVKDVVGMLAAARHRAVNEGRAQDVAIAPRAREVWLGDSVKYLPADLQLSVSSSAQLNEADAGVIRFYPEGGSSGGEVDIAVPGRAGVRIVVDWLVGGISQETYALN